MPDFHGIKFSDGELARIREGFVPGKPETNRISGIAVRTVLREKLSFHAAGLRKNGIVPTLAVVIVEDDEGSGMYAQSIVKECRKCEIEGKLTSLPESAGQSALVEELDRLNNDGSVHGIILLGPLPKGDYDELAAKAAIVPSKDLDALSKENTARFYLKGQEPLYYPPTIGGALLALEVFGVDVSGKRVAVMGRGNLVGRPIGMALMDRFNCTITYCHTKTPNPRDILLNAEVIVAATGKPHILDADDVPDNVVLLDMGVYYQDKKIVGEFTKAAYDKAYAALKTPGGSGTMTVCYLLHNCLLACQQRNF